MSVLPAGYHGNNVFLVVGLVRWASYIHLGWCKSCEGVTVSGMAGTNLSAAFHGNKVFWVVMED